jgi:hypothetical protein
VPCWSSPTSRSWNCASWTTGSTELWTCPWTRRVWNHRSLRRPLGSELRRLAELQADAATLFDAVGNSFKLVGDPYLARLYRIASRQLHLEEWDTSIRRRLATAESIYSKITDYHTTRRMEILEWIVILLIALEIVLFSFGH